MAALYTCSNTSNNVLLVIKWDELPLNITYATPMFSVLKALMALAGALPSGKQKHIGPGVPFDQLLVSALLAGTFRIKHMTSDPAY